MSYRGHGGRRKFNRDDDYYDRPRENYESPEEKIRNVVVKMGDVDPDVDLPRVAKQLQEQATSSIPAISEGFRIGVTEEPFKIPHYAALLRFLHFPTNGLEFPESFGKQVLDDLWKAFQAFLDKLMWREVRLFVQFFGHLTTAQVVSSSSMLSLLRSFVAVLDEFGVSHARAKNAALCATEGLLTAGSSLKQHAPEEVTSFINAIQAYAESVSFNKSLVSSLITFGEDQTSEGAEEILDCAISILKALDTSNFESTSTYYLQPYSQQPELDFSEVPPFKLPAVLVPPEVIDMDHLPQEGESGAQTEKKEEWPEFYVKLFDGAITAQLHDPRGFFVRSLISDVVDIYEVNRKECARLLLEITKWLPTATFKPRSGSSQDVEELEGPLWQLESCLLEAILGKSFVLPDATHSAVYYMTLITELCKISPSTVGPAVGKSIRKMYTFLADGLDPEIARRFTDWFAEHMSNFGFQWVWKEWIPDLSEVSHHPKRLFIRRAIDIEIRLSYYDRIVKTLPGPFQDPALEAIPEQAPGPQFDYDDPLKPYHETAQSVLNLLRGRSKAEDVIALIESLKSSLAESSDSDINVEMVVRAITIQSLLHVGSRSFSHFLNAVERYLPLLRVLASSAEAKSDIMASVVDFWRRNKQMVIIVADKLMQYQIVEPSDICSWAFQSESAVTIDAFKWDLIQGALGKANGRVLTSKRKVSMLRKQEDDERARMEASMEVDAEAPPETPVDESPALATALKAYAALTREQRAVLSKTLNSFVEALAPHGKVLTREAWEDRASWTNAEWDVWQTWGWYRNFCRMYAPHLRKYSTSLSTIAFAKYEGSSNKAIALLKNVWNVAMGQES